MDESTHDGKLVLFTVVHTVGSVAPGLCLLFNVAKGCCKVRSVFLTVVITVLPLRHYTTATFFPLAFGLWTFRNNPLSRHLDLASRTAWELTEHGQGFYFLALTCHYGAVQRVVAEYVYLANSVAARLHDSLNPLLGST